jgi:D-aspartate oxidase
MKIKVLGSGIIGVNSALRLQKDFPTACIEIIADKFNEDTLSAGAAGIFRPGTNFQGPSEEITQKWIEDAYAFYDGILRSEDASRAGVMDVSGYIFSSKFSSVTKNYLLENLLPVYRPASPEELKICPGDWKYGAFFQTMVIECADFLPWGLEIFKRNGGTVTRKNVKSLDELSDCDYLINCSGLGTKWLTGDNRMVPLRGQVFKVKAPWVKMFYYGDYDTYVIPGRNTVTLGGCRQFDSYNEEVDPFDSQGIWSRCTSLVPSLKKSQVVREWVGLRPYRDRALCDLERKSNNGMKIVHCVGFGGYGVTVAPGAAAHVSKVVSESLRGKEFSTFKEFTRAKL